MIISYFDESGDDGYPHFSSPFFVMANIYMSDNVWQDNFEKIINARRLLKNAYGIPVKQELHMKEFIQDKGVFHGKFLPNQRREIIFRYVKLIKTLDLRIINVVINKLKACQKKRINYEVLKNAFSYNIQRLENYIDKDVEDDNFIIITDEGRLEPMTKIARETRRINFIPSRFNQGVSLQRRIKHLIEDPLAKKSKESYFIQIADFIAYIVYLYALRNIANPNIAWGKRVRQVLNYGDEIKLLEEIKNRLNTKASGRNIYGIVSYPL
jgi:hypothetical protein